MKRSLRLGCLWFCVYPFVFVLVVSGLAFYGLSLGLLGAVFALTSPGYRVWLRRQRGFHSRLSKLPGMASSSPTILAIATLSYAFIASLLSWLLLREVFSHKETAFAAAIMGMAGIVLIVGWLIKGWGAKTSSVTQEVSSIEEKREEARIFPEGIFSYLKQNPFVLAVITLSFIMPCACGGLGLAVASSSSLAFTPTPTITVTATPEATALPSPTKTLAVLSPTETQGATSTPLHETSTPVPSLTVTPHGTPTSTSTSTSTSTPTPTQTPTENLSLIVDTAKIIGAPVSRVEQMLGRPLEVDSFGIGEIAEVPDGGEMRTYQVGKYTLWVAFDKQGKARGVQVIEGLSEDGYSLEQWPIVLERMGVGYVGAPDVEAPAGVRWTNAYGYTIWIATNKIGGDIWTVRIYKLP